MEIVPNDETGCKESFLSDNMDRLGLKRNDSGRKMRDSNENS